MRQTPYNFTVKQTPPAPAAPPEEQPTLTKKSFEDSVVRDLSAEIARPVNNPKTETTETQQPAAGNAQQATETSETTQQPASSATMEEGVKKLKEQIEQQYHANISDPKRAGKNVLKFINMARFIVYPWIYKRVIFDGPEQQALEPLLKKIADARIKNTEPELNNFEKYLHGKYEKFSKLREGVLWSAEEIDQINEVAYMKLAEIKFLRWLMENEWALVIIYIESKRWVPVFGVRMGFGVPDMEQL